VGLQWVAHPLYQPEWPIADVFVAVLVLHVIFFILLARNNATLFSDAHEQWRTPGASIVSIVSTQRLKSSA